MRCQELTTARLFLVTPDASFASDVFEYASMPEFCDAIGSPAPSGQEESAAFLNGLAHDNVAGKRMYWVVQRGSDAKAIGSMGFIFPFASRHAVAEFGFGLSPACWGQGCFGEAARVVLAYGFDTLGLHRVQAQTRMRNRRAIRALKALGFVAEATLAEFYSSHAGDTREDGVLMRLLKDEFGLGHGA